MIRLSAVIPCFNESDNIPFLRERLTNLPLFRKGDMELILVDDGSSDNTWNNLLDWAHHSRQTVAIKLHGNHGNQRAILSGLSVASGNFIGILDADLQDPPELLESMLEILENTRCCCVIGLKTRRQDRSAVLGLIKDLASSILPFRRGEGDFCILDKNAARESLVQGGAQTPFRVRRRRALRGRPIQYLSYERAFRVSGDTKFTIASLTSLWWRIFKSSYGEFHSKREFFLPPIDAIIRTNLKDNT